MASAEAGKTRFGESLPLLKRDFTVTFSLNFVPPKAKLLHGAAVVLLGPLFLVHENSGRPRRAEIGRSDSTIVHCYCEGEVDNNANYVDIYSGDLADIFKRLLGEL